MEILRLEKAVAMTEWKLIPDEVLNAAKRYFFATPAFVDPRLSDEAFLIFSRMNVGQCVMVYEGMNANHLIRDYLSFVYPKQVERFAAVMDLSRETCRTGSAQIAWKDPEWKAIANPEHEITESAALALLEVSSSDYLKSYQEMTSAR